MASQRRRRREWMMQTPPDSLSYFDHRTYPRWPDTLTAATNAASDLPTAVPWQGLAASQWPKILIYHGSNRHAVNKQAPCGTVVIHGASGGPVSHHGLTDPPRCRALYLTRGLDNITEDEWTSIVRGLRVGELSKDPEAAFKVATELIAEGNPGGIRYFFFPVETHGLQLLAVLLQGYLAVHDAIDRSECKVDDCDWKPSDFATVFEVLGWNEEARIIFGSSLPGEKDAAAKELLRRLAEIRNAQYWLDQLAEAVPDVQDLQSSLKREWESARDSSQLPQEVSEFLCMLKQQSTVAPPKLAAKCLTTLWKHLMDL